MLNQKIDKFMRKNTKSPQRQLALGWVGLGWVAVGLGWGAPTGRALGWVGVRQKRVVVGLGRPTQRPNGSLGRRVGLFLQP